MDAGLQKLLIALFAAVFLASLALLGCVQQTGAPEPTPQATLPQASHAAVQAPSVQAVSGLKALFVIAPQNFRDEELFDSKRALEEKGVSVTIASTSKAVAKGSLGKTVSPQLLVSEASPRDYAAVVFIGGPGVEQYALYNKTEILELAKEFAAEGKIVAAICIAPRILARAGLLAGKKATGFADAETIRLIKEGGGNYTAKSVEADGKIITADGPGSARAFGEKIASLIK